MHHTLTHPMRTFNVHQALTAISAFAALVLAMTGPAAMAATNTVRLTDQNRFEPQTLTVRVGQTVTWNNSSAAVHTVTDDPGLAAKPVDVALPKGAKPFNSGFLKAKAVFKHRFTVPGTYRYFCILHEGLGMVGTVVVKP